MCLKNFYRIHSPQILFFYRQLVDQFQGHLRSQPCFWGVVGVSSTYTSREPVRFGIISTNHLCTLFVFERKNQLSVLVHGGSKTTYRHFSLHVHPFPNYCKRALPELLSYSVRSYPLYLMYPWGSYSRSRRGWGC